VTEEAQGEAQWLRIAKESYDASTSYVDANWRKSWERNIAIFQSRHPPGSKYNTEPYKHRSKLFRPKTKATVRKNEAAAAAAFFSNVDVVSVEPENDADPTQVVGSEVMNELINYRLTSRKQIPWYLTLIGAFQEAQVIGVVASYQYWEYKEKTEKAYEPLTDDQGQPMVNALGEQLAYESNKTIRVKDKPCIDLIPIENIRFDPGANWTNVVDTSPYIIRKVPLYVDQVRTKMTEGKWKTYSDGEIRAAMSEYDTTRQAREAKRQDPLADNAATLKEFEIVWVHENFVRLGGEEVVYWTLGTQHMLTAATPIKEAYKHGERPIVIGVGLVEAHKPMPDSLVAIGSELQKEANEITNQRMDNVRLVLNKKWIIKRGKQVDTGALMRNVPGGAILADDPDTDIRELTWPDVTASSYQEQDRLNVDFDELVGSFSQSSVQTNRQLNETVGGMQLAAGGASQLTEYLIRTFAETWVEPVLNQLCLLEAVYEDDENLLNLVAGKTDLMKNYGIESVTEDMLLQPYTVRVNVGMGATDPLTKQAKFTNAMQSYSGIMANVPDADAQAVRREVFGLVGYKDGGRFFKDQGNDPEKAAMQQQIQELQGQLQQAMAELENKQADRDVKMAETQFKTQELAIREQEVNAEVVKAQIEASMPPEQNLDAEIARLEAAEADLVSQGQILALQKQVALLQVKLGQVNAVNAVRQAQEPVNAE
jgi:hypothetical protein